MLATRVVCSREANALALANKRAIDTKWRDEERKDDAKAKAQKRADDPEWREISSETLTRTRRGKGKPLSAATFGSQLMRATRSSTSC